MATPFNQIPAGQFVTNTDFDETMTSEVSTINNSVTTINDNLTAQINATNQNLNTAVSQLVPTTRFDSEIANLVTTSTFNTQKTQVSCGGQMTHKQNSEQTTFISGQPKSIFQNPNFTQSITYGNNPPTRKNRVGNGGGTGFKINKAGYYQVYGGYRVAGDNVTEQQQVIIEVDDANNQTVALNSDGNIRRTTNNRWAVNSTGSSRITRINPYLHAGMFLNQNDSVYLCIRGNSTNVNTHNFSYYFSVQFVSDNVVNGGLP